ncbi:MAG: ribonuclease D [Candidatus Methylomirabilia bacterium]
MIVPPYRLFDRGPDVAAFFAAVRSETVLALDLEADSLHHYPEKICLVQISTPSETAILDPLAAPEVLDGLESVLADAAVRKIVHGGDYDVRLLKREREVPVRNLFDTMIAAQFTGRERFGLAALLEEHFGVVLDKRYQRADWSRRPLGPELLAYAAADTAHLHALSGRLAAELSALGRLAWAEEEFRLLERIEPGVPKKPWCLDVKGARRLAPRELARLQALLETREELARAWDRPPFMVLGNQTLVDWAQAPPASHRDLVRTPGAGRGLLERVADRALEALARADAVPERDCPRSEPSRRTVLDASETSRLSRLKSVREETARRLGLAPGLLVNGATLERLACPGSAGAGLLKNWQAEALGAPFLQALG